MAPHQLLLVPKRWVFWRMLRDPDAFYNRHATGTLQQERTTYVDGRKIARPRRRSNRRTPDVKGLNNQQAAKYKRDGVDLVAQYRAEVDAEYEHLDDEQLAARM